MQKPRTFFVRASGARSVSILLFVPWFLDTIVRAIGWRCISFVSIYISKYTFATLIHIKHLRSYKPQFLRYRHTT